MHKKYIENKTKKIQGFANAINHLSLGISIVVAILIGIGIGKLLAKLYEPLFFFGLALGIAAAILNVYKAYKMLLKDAKELENIKTTNTNDDED